MTFYAGLDRHRPIPRQAICFTENGLLKYGRCFAVILGRLLVVIISILFGITARYKSRMAGHNVEGTPLCFLEASRGCAEYRPEDSGGQDFAIVAESRFCSVPPIKEGVYATIFTTIGRS
jgi:hypothetical protein